MAKRVIPFRIARQIIKARGAFATAAKALTPKRKLSANLPTLQPEKTVQQPTVATPKQIRPAPAAKPKSTPLSKEPYNVRVMAAFLKRSAEHVPGIQKIYQKHEQKPQKHPGTQVLVVTGDLKKDKSLQHHVLELHRYEQKYHRIQTQKPPSYKRRLENLKRLHVGPNNQARGILMHFIFPGLYTEPKPVRRVKRKSKIPLGKGPHLWPEHMGGKVKLKNPPTPK